MNEHRSRLWQYVYARNQYHGSKWFCWHDWTLLLNKEYVGFGKMYVGCVKCGKNKITEDLPKQYKDQTTFVWCDCGNELCSNGDLVSDTEVVLYVCSWCGRKSRWDFDAPSPIRLMAE